MKKQAFAQGLGRHSREEVEAMAMEDIRILSQHLGEEKDFIMGGQSPTELDCVLFG